MNPAASSAAAPTIGRIVHYRQARGSNAWLPAIVTVTEETFVPGIWSTPGEVSELTLAGGPSARVDRDGETYAASALPPVKQGRVHLKVLSPIGYDYCEFNVAEGEEPGCWRWPPRDQGAST